MRIPHTGPQRKKADPIRPLPLLTLLTLLALTGCGQTEKEEEIAAKGTDNAPPVFEKIDPAQSGINFKNTIQENLSSLENLFNFDYFYNGAGVGLADLNNDGNLDIFFCGNQVPNRLYLNRGGMQFEDVTEGSGINQGKNWSNGVTFADINADGWLDIYVSQGGPNPRLSRKNLLLINQQDGTFKETGESAGLADMGISTQSAFLDYDSDGDLDCIVMNENEFYGVDPIQLQELLRRDPEAPYFNSSHLYRNDGGTFTDVTQEAGILRPIFGLGLSVSDINRDGLPDIYIASDYYLPDALFINQGDGTFRDRIKEHTRQISYYGMGIDIADIDNDGMQDIFVLDMASSDHYRSKTLMASMDVGRFNYLVGTAGYHHQYMYNSLQLNEGNNQFSNIAQLTGMASTDWSWSVLMSDFDLDSDKDVYVTNGYRRYALDNDLQQRVYQARQQYGNDVPLTVKTELYNSMPSEKLPNLLYENQTGLSFEEHGSQWGLGDLSFSNGAAMGDLDNDGDPDLVVNNMDEEAFLYRNRSREDLGRNYLRVVPGGETSEAMPTVTVYHDGTTQLIEVRRVRGYRSAQEKVAQFGLGTADRADSVRVTWPSGRSLLLTDVPANQTLTVRPDDASKSLEPRETDPWFRKAEAADRGITGRHIENEFNDLEKEILLPYMQSRQGPCMEAADINGDGIQDVFIGGASGQAAQLYLGTPQGFRRQSVPAFTTDKIYEDTGVAFLDLEGDGDLDLYVVSGGNAFVAETTLYTDRIYLNDGQGTFTRDTRAGHQPSTYSGKAIAALDYDNDGDQDLVVGNRVLAQQYPRHAPSLLLENRGGTLVDVTNEKAPALTDFGIVNALLVTDYDGDGTQDLLAAGEWTDIGFFRVSPEGLQPDADAGAGQALPGWWFSITETDANADGLPDYILGNVGKNFKFSASPEKPFKVFATDFDRNGTHDVVLSKQYHGEYVPVRGRECSSQQMPFIAEKFPSYSEFASASLEEVYGRSLDESYSREARTFSSTLLLNRGNGSFEARELPVQAQLIPVMDVVSTDLDGDGLDDLILAGNIYETEVETPRLDALSGKVLRSLGDGTYQPVSHLQTGLFMEGNIKSLLALEKGGTFWLLAGRNDDSPLLWQNQRINTDLTAFSNK